MIQGRTHITYKSHHSLLHARCTLRPLDLNTKGVYGRSGKSTVGKVGVIRHGTLVAVVESVVVKVQGP